MISHRWARAVRGTDRCYVYTSVSTVLLFLCVKRRKMLQTIPTVQVEPWMSCTTVLHWLTEGLCLKRRRQGGLLLSESNVRKNKRDERGSSPHVQGIKAPSNAQSDFRTIPVGYGRVCCTVQLYSCSAPQNYGRSKIRIFKRINSTILRSSTCAELVQTIQ